jgi:hypothetical protein
MATTDHISTRGALARAVSAVALATALILVVTASSHRPSRPGWTAGLDADELELTGFAGHVPDSVKPKLTAYFLRESYPRSGRARLVVTDSATDVTVQFFRAGGERSRTLANDQLRGAAMRPPMRIGDVRGKRIVPLVIGPWPSGVYYAQLRARDRVGYAPFVLRPTQLGEHRVAIVMPTQTWQAYNFRDDDGDGRPDTWYAGNATARLIRPFLDRGVPPHFTYYDAPILRWALRTNHAADYLSDRDLNVTSGERLRRAYELIVFEGHHEYVTKHEYDAVERYRDLGGNLMFLSANNFYYVLSKRGNMMKRTGTWRSLGRPEAALIGVQFFRNDEGEHRGKWVIQRSATSLRWLVAGTALQFGSHLTSGGIEADATAEASPPGVRVLARIPNLFGDGRDAEMSYYESAGGAKVFAAGAFTLAGAVGQPPVSALIGNLWDHLSKD